MESRSWTDLFNAFARQSAAAVGSPWVFLFAIVVVIAWGFAGALFHYSNTWQLVINTGTTIVTFLIVFLIQNTQNRDAKAIHLKLDELIHKIKGARNTLIALETCTDEELDLARLAGAQASVLLAYHRNDVNLVKAVDSRHRIGIAQGIIMQRYQLDVTQSFQVLRRLSQHLNQKLSDIANYVVDNRALPPTPDAHNNRGQPQSSAHSG